MRLYQMLADFNGVDSKFLEPSERLYLEEYCEISAGPEQKGWFGQACMVNTRDRQTS